MLNLSLWTHLMNVIPELEFLVIPRGSRRGTDRLPNFVVYTSSEARLTTSGNVVIAKEKVLDSSNVRQSWNDRELKINEYNFFTYSRFCNIYCRLILGCEAESCYTEGLTQEGIKLQANNWLEGPGVVTTPKPLCYNKHQFHFKFLQKKTWAKIHFSFNYLFHSACLKF